jgi:hypothetical protein
VTAITFWSFSVYGKTASDFGSMDLDGKIAFSLPTWRRRCNNQHPRFDHLAVEICFDDIIGFRRIAFVDCTLSFPSAGLFSPHMEYVGHRRQLPWWTIVQM